MITGHSEQKGHPYNITQSLQNKHRRQTTKKSNRQAELQSETAKKPPSPKNSLLFVLGYLKIFLMCLFIRK